MNSDTLAGAAEHAAPATVLVGIANPQTIQPLMRVAARIAHPGSSRVLATRVIVVPGQMSLSSARSSPEVAAASRLLQDAIDAGAADGLAVDGVIEIGRNVHEGLAAAAASRAADLVILGWSAPREASTDPDESACEQLMHRVARGVDGDLIVA